MSDKDETVNVDLEPEDALRILLDTDLREPAETPPESEDEEPAGEAEI